MFALKKDLLISVIGHCALMVLIIFFNPNRGMFRSTPDVMNIDLSQLMTPAGAGQTETPKAIATSKPVEDESVSPKEKPQAKKEKAMKTEETKQKARNDGKGGLDVSTKVGPGSGEGDGENIGGANLPYNLALVISIIERAWRNPVNSATPILCTIYCQIDRDGSVIGEPIVEKSSGIGVFDQAAIYAIKRAGQFPPFPSDFGYDYIGLHLDFEYAP